MGQWERFRQFLLARGDTISPSSDEIEKPTPATTITPIITGIITTSFTEGISSLHSSLYIAAIIMLFDTILRKSHHHVVPIISGVLTRYITNVN